ncbi:putative RNA-binding protein [Cyphellophora attinorum]|uniref:Putative RNA-binding protein n=1 Tax=Cyphellophora attinorum TaxID=1664694 RepID=A0A0N0NR79_9EURO|nr:putative RNA-binding protein [Phialophora attinorum]KPI44778.1 putative RNA-binding protein [Phialophora attinorum]
MTAPPSPSNPPLEAQRFGRSQTPESPRPIHIAEPTNIPVLQNQMDPVFNDTATHNVPHDQPFASFTEPAQPTTNTQNDENDAVQDFFRAAEEESLRTLPLNPPNQAATEITASTLVNGSAPDLPANDAPAPVLNDHAAVLDPAAEHEELGQGIETTVSEAQEKTAPAEPDATQDKPGNDGGVDYQSLLDTISQSASTAPAAENLTTLTTTAPIVEHDQSTSSLPTIPGLPPKPPAIQLPADVTSYQIPESSLSATSAIDGPISQVDKLATTQSFVYEASPNAAAMYPAEGTSQPQFLEDERGFVTDGVWDRFPAGSRLFVGNLPSEKVTKRDLFHIFHRHGKLAQISIKQAYGFVQFLQASDCYKALEADQGVEIRGRKIHLEISKPQKNTRNNKQNDRAANNNNQHRRRSRSPARRVSDDRHDFRDRRDNYRRERSPSPRGYRRDSGRYDARSPPRAQMSVQTQPYPPVYPPVYQQPQQPYDEDAALPLPRRNPQDVPDVQLLILDQSVPQAFINCPRLPLQAVIKRQILEGVHAIVKLLQVNSISYKIPLQVFDRSSGASNVKFNEYVDLDLNVAGDIVVHTKRSQPSPLTPHPPTPAFNNAQYGQQPMQSPQQWSPQGQPHYPPQGQPQYQPQYQQRPPQPPYPYTQQQQQPQYGQPQTPTPQSAGSNAPNLQQLLANLSKPNEPQSAGPISAPVQGRPDLSGLLSNIAASQQNQQQQPYSAQISPQSYGTTPNSAQGYGPAAQNNVSNIMAQLARYQR